MRRGNDHAGVSRVVNGHDHIGVRRMLAGRCPCLVLRAQCRRTRKRRDARRPAREPFAQSRAAHHTSTLPHAAKFVHPRLALADRQASFDTRGHIDCEHDREVRCGLQEGKLAAALVPDENARHDAQDSEQRPAAELQCPTPDNQLMRIGRPRSQYQGSVVHARDPERSRLMRRPKHGRQRPQKRHAGEQEKYFSEYFHTQF